MKILRQLLRYPAATMGLTLIAVMILVAIYALITIPHREAVRLWRGGGEEYGRTTLRGPGRSG